MKRKKTRRRGNKVWVRGHCRRRATSSFAKRERAKKAMPF